MPIGEAVNSLAEDSRYRRRHEYRESETLLELARKVGLDTDQLEEDWEDVDLRQSSREVETPKITIHIDGEIVTQPGPRPDGRPLELEGVAPSRPPPQQLAEPIPFRRPR